MTGISGVMAEASPWHVMNDDVETYCWHAVGWECASEFSVADARKRTRGQAAAAFARDFYGDIRKVRVWKRYVRPLTRQDAWDYNGRERWCWRNETEDDGPDHPPADWRPDWESDPTWEFVHRDHPDAIPVWICAEKGSAAPHNPSRESIR